MLRLGYVQRADTLFRWARGNTRYVFTPGSW